MFWVWVFLLIIILSIISIIHCFQRWILFNPVRNHVWTPDLPYTDVHISGPKSSSIHGWYFNNHPGMKTVLFCHGNTGNISHRNYIVSICHQKQLNLLIFDYREYGKSLGTVSQHGICQDGVQMYHYLMTRINPQDLVIWGESLGGAVAAHIASRYPCSALVLWSTFSSIDDIMTESDVAGILKLVTKMICHLFNTLPNRNYLGYVTCPVMIVHSTEDEIIPYSHAQIMWNHIRHPHKEILPIKGGHSTPRLTESEFERLFQFMGVNTDDCYACCQLLDQLQGSRRRHYARTKEEYERAIRE